MTALITKNDYLNIVTDPDTGEKKLFGKIGYQTMHKGVDKYTLMNMAGLARAMEAGTLRDINGDLATDGCVIETYSILRIVKPADQVEQVASVRTLGGEEVAVPAAPAPTAGSVIHPFGQ